MDLGLTDRTGIVTGASAGLGRGIASALALEGVQLMIVARRPELLESLADELEARGCPRPFVVAEDLTAPDAAVRIATRALESMGRVDILVNNAGGHRPAGPSEPTSSGMPRSPSTSRSIDDSPRSSFRGCSATVGDASST